MVPYIYCLRFSMKAVLKIYLKNILYANPCKVLLQPSTNLPEVSLSIVALSANFRTKLDAQSYVQAKTILFFLLHSSHCYLLCNGEAQNKR